MIQHLKYLVFAIALCSHVHLCSMGTSAPLKSIDELYQALKETEQALEKMDTKTDITDIKEKNAAQATFISRAKELYALGESPFVIALKKGNINTARSLWNTLTTTAKECHDALNAATDAKQSESIAFLLRRHHFSPQFQNALARTVELADRQTLAIYTTHDCIKPYHLMTPELIELSLKDVPLTKHLLNNLMNGHQLMHILYNASLAPNGEHLGTLAEYAIYTSKARNHEAFLEACTMGYVNLVEVCLDHRFCTPKVEDNGLKIAIQKGHADLVRKILSCRSLETPADFLSLAIKKDNQACTDLLISQGHFSDHELWDYWEDALHNRCYECLEPLMHILAKSGSKNHAKLLTALIRAAQENQPKAIVHLLTYENFSIPELYQALQTSFNEHNAASVETLMSTSKRYFPAKAYDLAQKMQLIDTTGHPLIASRLIQATASGNYPMTKTIIEHFAHNTPETLKLAYAYTRPTATKRLLAQALHLQTPPAPAYAPKAAPALLTRRGLPRPQALNLKFKAQDPSSNT